MVFRVRTRLRGFEFELKRFEAGQRGEAGGYIASGEMYLECSGECLQAKGRRGEWQIKGGLATWKWNGTTVQ